MLIPRTVSLIKDSIELLNCLDFHEIIGCRFEETVVFENHEYRMSGCNAHNVEQD